MRGIATNGGGSNINDFSKLFISMSAATLVLYNQTVTRLTLNFSINAVLSWKVWPSLPCTETTTATGLEKVSRWKWLNRSWLIRREENSSKFGMLCEDDVLAWVHTAQDFCAKIGTTNFDEDLHIWIRSMVLRCLKSSTVLREKKVLLEFFPYVILNQNAGHESLFRDFQAGVRH